MAKPERRDREKERYWRRMLRRWRQGGLTGRDFCAEHSLSEPSFYAWRREIAARDEERVAARAARTKLAQKTGVDGAAGVVQAMARPAFVKVAVPIQVPIQTLPTIDVFLAQGRRLRVCRGFDAELLRQLLRVLEEPLAENGRGEEPAC